MSTKNPISIEVLEILDAIDRRGSYAKAAEELNKATSALSYAVQKLEEQLDIALFQRQGRRAALTPAGRLLLEEGRLILEHSRKMVSRALEVATGWEPRIRIAVESVATYEWLFEHLAGFLTEFPSIEIDMSECVLNGGWEALEEDRVDLLVGAPGPVPRQQGFRSISMGHFSMLPVVAGTHPLAEVANDRSAIESALQRDCRRIIAHDSSLQAVLRSAGLADEGRRFYVQTMEQKLQAILAGVGVGHIPVHRAQPLINSGKLVELDLDQHPDHENFLVWKLSNKGRGLQALTKRLSEGFGA